MAKAKTRKSAGSTRASGSRKLRVFRTPIGFHDAYVAAPSQKAALEAWGSDSNLFAAGAAEAVTDPVLMKDPLARPGEVVRRLRGSADEQVAALGKAPRKKEAGPRLKSGSAKKAKTSPRPSRAAVDRAEQALTKTEARHKAALDRLRAQEAALQQRRRDMEREQRSEREALNDKVEQERERYRAAMADWAE